MRPIEGGSRYRDGGTKPAGERPQPRYPVSRLFRRDTPCQRGGGLGVTDPVSGPVVMDLNSRARKRRPFRLTGGMAGYRALASALHARSSPPRSGSRKRFARTDMLQLGASFQEGSEMLKYVTTMIGYLMLVSTTALAQATPTTTADLPWVWIIVGIIIVGGVIWWYMNRSRGPRI